MTAPTRIRSALLALVTWSVAGLSHGQEVTQDTQIEEVIVTAQKRPERLQNVPAQVDVLTAQNLDTLQIRQAPEIAATVPNLTVARNDTYKNSTVPEVVHEVSIKKTA